MPLDQGETMPSAVQLVFGTPPSDDAGASTADRYDWQASMAAADGLALYREALNDLGELPPEADGRIVCEHHEDWVTVLSDDAELVSAKHRETSQGAYTTINQLMGDGGVAHLFGRWAAMNEKPTCRLVCTAGLDPGPPQAMIQAATKLRMKRLAGQTTMIDDDHKSSIDACARALMRHPQHIPESWRPGLAGGATDPTAAQLEQTGRFLSMFSIQDSQPTRTHVRYAAPLMYAKPVLDRLGCPTVAPEAVWEAVVGLFRVRMRAAGPLPEGGLPEVLAYRPGALVAMDSSVARPIRSRIVTLADIDVAVRTAIANPDGYLPLRRVVRTTRVAVKMAVGACSDNSIERAEQLRADYQAYWRLHRNIDPTGRMKQAILRRTLLRISDAATTSVRNPTGKWGPELWMELQARLNLSAPGQWAEDMDTELALGGICELANRCQVWFSDRFDVAAEIAYVRAQQGSQP